MLTRANVRAAIANHAAAAERASIATSVERSERLTTILRECDNPLAVIKAIDVLNKIDGLYVQKVAHVGPVQLIVSQTDEQL